MGSRNAGFEEFAPDAWSSRSSPDPTLIEQRTAAPRDRIVRSRGALAAAQTLPALPLPIAIAIARPADPEPVVALSAAAAAAAAPR
jgi:hypothetical protein